MTTLSTVKARENFSDPVNRSAYGKERVVLTRRGKGVVAVVPIEDLKLLEANRDGMLLRIQKGLLAASESLPLGLDRSRYCTDRAMVTTQKPTSLTSR